MISERQYAIGSCRQAPVDSRLQTNKSKDPGFGLHFFVELPNVFFSGVKAALINRCLCQRRNTAHLIHPSAPRAPRIIGLCI